MLQGRIHMVEEFLSLVDLGLIQAIVLSIACLNLRMGCWPIGVIIQ